MARRDSRGGYWTAPNEELPQRALPLLRRAPAGAYVAVGSERGFIASANAPGASSLWLFDVDPEITRYNRLNIALLAAAQGRERYLELRLTKDPGTWSFAASNPGLSEENADALGDPENHRRWRQALSFRPPWWRPLGFHRQRSFEALHAPPDPGAGPDRPFAGVNYLFEEPLFTRLSMLAKNGRIRARTLDLADRGGVASLAREVRAAGQGLAVLDLSNLWWLSYTWNGDFAEALGAFDSAASAESVLLLTALTPPSPRGLLERLRRRSLLSWEYRGYRFSDIRSRPSFLAFVRSLRWGWLTGPGIREP